MSSFDEAAEKIIAQALELRAKHQEPESVDVAFYTSAESLRAAGISLSLEEHAAMAEKIAAGLEAHGFTVNRYAVPVES